MTMRKRILLTVLWILGCFVLGIVLAIAVVSGTGSSRARQARSAQLGSATAVVASIGCAALWLPWAAEQGRRRRAARAQSQQPPAKRRRSS